MQEINLLQNRLQEKSFAWDRQSKLIITFLSIVFILILGAFGVFYLLNSKVQTQVQTTVAQNQELRKQLDSKQQGLSDAKAFQAQLANIKTLVNSHVYLSPLLDELAKMTYVKSQYFSLSAGIDGKLHLEGRVDNYVDLGKLLLGLSTSSKFKSVQLTSVLPSLGKINGYQFSINLTASPTLFTQ
ncbi:MAG TPA: hypothetical protein VL306_02740 [Methylomirabilota bacterium]|jgi:Tfp pilus assembly protein PilN|nr:hypothetical protein [Methylomirabilota bacterium]